MTEYDAQFAGWAVTAILVLAGLSIISLTLVIQMILTGRMGLKRRQVTALGWEPAPDGSTENPHGFERPL